ncbi:MAG: signal peptidase I, partial [Acidimicrobiia bacterium]|nr:signal peptidase I [Acidimicrobiia bacterium]
MLQLVALVVSALAVLVVAGLALGYRPVVITTGSMGDTMPPGALVVAEPVRGDAVTVGDVVVMRRPGQTPVTHRVIELQHIDGLPVAVTQGDANESPDAAPYPLEGNQLTARWSIVGLGQAVTVLAQPVIVLSVATILLLAGATWALRRVWRQPPDEAPPSEPASRQGYTRLGAAVALGTLVATTGLGWTLYRATDAVSANAFGASGCYEAEVASVQTGTVINGGPGAQVTTISAVDSARSFLVFTVQSASNEPADALVQGRLASPTAIEFLRHTDAGGAPALTIEWSVIEYRCGVSVQRGVATGNGLSTMDLPISTVDPTRSFVLTSTAPPSTATTLDGSTFHTAELAAADTIRLRTDASQTLPAAASYAWQVVEFASSADGSVQAQPVALGPSDSAATVNLASPVDPATTFVLATSRVNATGVAIEDRLIRAHLSSPTTVEIRRRTAGPDLVAHVQVISLADGSTVRHGTVDMASGELAKAIPLDPVDPTRATAMA